MLRLIVALGNPGPKYAYTRHNIAWLMLERVSFFPQLSWQNKFKGEYASHSLNGETIYFLKPQTYMNLSGESVQPLAHFLRIEPDQILVIHDDIELPFGVIGFKTNGGLAGHNGLRSISNKLGTRDFKRLRLGVSRPVTGTVEAYVLSNFSAEEQMVLPIYLNKAAQLLEKSLTEDFGVMEQLYRKQMLLDANGL